ncbi:hypothetical protein D7V86_01000 [bacterium D16-51]|nr:hypothetical protein D7V96_04320 [bacterium D16-59]RKI62810.1 hypothetical protein D7V86_01000 [bacterium D16-51]
MKKIKIPIKLIVVLILLSVEWYYLDRVYKRYIHRFYRKNRRNTNYYNFLLDWIHMKEEGRALEEWFKRKSINSIAIYGTGTLGEIVYKEIRSSSVDIICLIDKNASGQWDGINILGIEEYKKQGFNPDVILVTAINNYDDILESNRELADKMISVSEILTDMMD